MRDIDDILYEKVKGPDGVREESQVINGHVVIDYTVTTQNGIETWKIKTIRVSSGGIPPTHTVIVDSNTIAQPPPVYDDYCCG